MQRAGEEHQGTMAAIIGLSSEIVHQICQEAISAGVVQCANFNSPGQIVISGSVDGVHAAMQLAKAKGAKMVKELVVSGAFHSPLMQGAREGLAKALASTPVYDARIPVYTNVTAQPVIKASEIRQRLEEQLTAPVRWEESVTAMIRDGATTFVEIGPGKVLQGLVKRINSTVEVRGIETLEDLPQAVVP
jgi:[acyl-carrier-protein] S-malonyltransferase